MKYCKKCGHEIDSITKKCSGCGKQYTNIFSILLALIYAVLLFSLVYMYNQYTTAVDMFMLQEKLINQEFEERFGHLQNPLTGEYITGYQAYLDALDAQMEITGETY